MIILLLVIDIFNLILKILVELIKQTLHNNKYKFNF